MDGEAAGEQADGGEYGKVEHLARSGAGEALAEVVEVGDDEDGEDSGFGDDEAGHADDSARGQGPGGGLRNAAVVAQGAGLLLFVATVGVVWMLDVPEGTAALDGGDDGEVIFGGGEGVDHSSVQASHGSGPAMGPLKYDQTML